MLATPWAVLQWVVQMNVTGGSFFAVWLVLFFLASVPVLSMVQPPLADYLNHLARVHIWLPKKIQPPRPCGQVRLEAGGGHWNPQGLPSIIGAR